MTHSIENSKGTLVKLMEQVNDNHAKSADFLTPTNQLQFRTNPETGDWAPESRIIMEGSGGEPTRFFDLNDVAFSQVAVDAGLDTKTARKLQRVCPEEFDGVMNKLLQS